MVESEKCLRKTSDEALLHGGGGKNSAPLALLQKPALRPVLNLIQDLFQGRLLFPVLALGGVLLFSGCAKERAKMHYNKAISLEKKGNPVEAEKELRKAIRLKPDIAEAHSELGNITFDQGRLGEAEEEYREAIRLMPSNYDANHGLNCILWIQGKKDEAIKVIVKAEGLRGGRLLGLEVNAQMKDREGKRKSARTWWESALKSEPRPGMIEAIKKRLAERE